MKGSTRQKQKSAKKRLSWMLSRGLSPAFAAPFSNFEEVSVTNFLSKRSPFFLPVAGRATISLMFCGVIKGNHHYI